MSKLSKAELGAHCCLVRLDPKSFAGVRYYRLSPSQKPSNGYLLDDWVPSYHNGYLVDDYCIQYFEATIHKGCLTELGRL
ncbi:hypothetical protein Acr_00g0028260 [Actinidia rufa]|uniref:Uncharacterized protein n=1 Tax=Actinidia rufa TaxID=165716 RepID=A0A7J0DE73_9ERIC|nr:hypothetical protein Acr_00g0028260 [Actinidia rufa]